MARDDGEVGVSDDDVSGDGGDAGGRGGGGGDARRSGVATMRGDDVGGGGRDDGDSVSRGGTPVPLSDGSVTYLLTYLPYYYYYLSLPPPGGEFFSCSFAPPWQWTPQVRMPSSAGWEASAPDSNRASPPPVSPVIAHAPNSAARRPEDSVAEADARLSL